MKLKDLIQGCDDNIIFISKNTLNEKDIEYHPDEIKLNINSLPDVNITNISYNSQNVKEGYLFVAIKGERYDGHNFITDAIQKGAVAIVYEKDIDFHMKDLTSRVNYTNTIFIRVENSRKILPCLSRNYYGDPFKDIKLIGVTGTNGKTTTTYIIKSILESWGENVGLIGTIQYFIKDRGFPAFYTTPESLEFYKLLKEMLLAGCKYVISEISSHALAQYRINTAIFNIAVFTNLTRDHLDFHGTMEEYFRAKERLFLYNLDTNGTAVINIDDPFGRRLISSKRIQQRNILTYGLKSEADIQAKDIDNSFSGLKFIISYKNRSYRVISSLLGYPNVYNILSATGVAISLGVPWDIILEGIQKIKYVPGRFERVDVGQDFVCIVDYAHSEDALERLIYTAKDLIDQYSTQSNENYIPRIITVFGCGGDRDHGKRPRMGAVATRLSDLVIITSDNPRSEDPYSIIREIESGTVNDNYIIEPDRKEAMRKAIHMARKSDILLIAGKGHEDYQEISGIRYRFHDKEILEELIRTRLNVKNAV